MTSGVVACALTASVAGAVATRVMEAVLLPATGSLVDEDVAAAIVTDPERVGALLAVTVTVVGSPTVIGLEIAHVTTTPAALQLAPDALLYVMPVGNVRATLGLTAGDGPAFVTVIVIAVVDPPTIWPAAIDTDRLAARTTATLSSSELFDGFGSCVVALTDTSTSAVVPTFEPTSTRMVASAVAGLAPSDERVQVTVDVPLHEKSPANPPDWCTVMPVGRCTTSDTALAAIGLLFATVAV